MTTTHYDETQTEDSITGTRRARAIELAWDTDKDGLPCIAAMLELIEGRPGYRLSGRLYMDESKPDAKGRTSLSRSVEALRAMGMVGEIPDDLSTIPLDGEVEAVVEINANGYPFAHYINAPFKGRDLKTFAPPDPGSLKSFLSRVNAGLRSADSAARASGVRPNAPAQTHQSARPAPSAPAQARAATANAHGNQARPSGGQHGQSARPAQPARNQPPPRMQGQSMGEFGDDPDSIPF